MDFIGEKKLSETHDFMWAIEQLNKLEKVRRPNYHKEVYLAIFNGNIVVYQKNDIVNNYTINLVDINSTDWELYEKPERTLYQKHICPYNEDGEQIALKHYEFNDVSKAIKKIKDWVHKKEAWNMYDFDDMLEEVIGKELIE